MLRNRRGQSTVEYAIVIGVIVAALVAMQTYIKRGLQARYHDGVEFLTAETDVIGKTNQYEPYYVESDYTAERSRVSNENIAARGQAVRTLADETTTRDVGGYEQYHDTDGAD